MSGKTAKAARKNSEPGVKKYSLSKEEETVIKRLLSTMGFFNTALEGIQLSLQVEQARIEGRCKLGQPKAGYKHQTRIDMESMSLLVKEVKIEEPKKPVEAKPSEEEVKN